MNNLRNSFKKLLQYPSAIAGLLVVALLVAVAVYTMVTIPYAEAIRLWRGGEDVWYQNPRFAPPAWINYFSSKKYSESFAVDTFNDKQIAKKVTPGKGGTSTVEMTYDFDFSYDEYPQEILFYFTSSYKEKQPFVSIELVTPDDRKIRIANFTMGNEFTYRFSQDEKLRAKLRTEDVIPALFSLPDGKVPLKGKYQALITGTTFEPDSTLDTEFVLHGQVFGLAGTDHARRDLTLPLLWGVPVALAFGLIASVGTSILTMIIAAVGAWYGGWVDELRRSILSCPFWRY
jgi:peptide/nickel transport system permease protein